MIMYQFTEKLGLPKELIKNVKLQKVKGMDEPVANILREINKSCWTIGTPVKAQSVLKRTCAT
jgi:formate dehydrogenase major subunit